MRRYGVGLVLVILVVGGGVVLVESLSNRDPQSRRALKSAEQPSGSGSETETPGPAPSDERMRRELSPASTAEEPTVATEEVVEPRPERPKKNPFLEVTDPPPDFSDLEKLTYESLAGSLADCFDQPELEPGMLCEKLFYAKLTPPYSEAYQVSWKVILASSTPTLDELAIDRLSEELTFLAERCNAVSSALEKELGISTESSARDLHKLHSARKEEFRGEFEERLRTLRRVLRASEYAEFLEFLQLLGCEDLP